jgi:hypothetical protein
MSVATGEAGRPGRPTVTARLAGPFTAILSILPPASMRFSQATG